MINLLHDAITDTDVKINHDTKEDDIIIIFNNFEFCKSNIKYYLEKKKKKLYNKLDILYDKLYENNYKYIKDIYIEYFNDIYYFYEDMNKNINDISFNDSFDYKFGEIKNNIKYNYNIIKYNLLK